MTRSALQIAAVSAILVGCGGSTSTSDSMSFRNGFSDAGVANRVTNELASKGAKLIQVDGAPMFIAGVKVTALRLGEKDPSFDVLKDISSLGLKVARVELFEGGRGLSLGDDGKVKGLEPAYEQVIKDLLEQAKVHRVRLYLALPGGASKQDPSPLTEEAARGAYLTNAVKPLIALCKENPAVLAIDLYPNPEAAVAGKDGSGGDKGATWDQVRSLLADSVQAVKAEDPGRLVTASSAGHGWRNLQAGRYKDLSLDFYDFHHFDDKGDLPKADDLKLDKPVIVGSFGPKAKSDEESQEKVAKAFVKNILDKGYAGFIASNYGDKSNEDPQNLVNPKGEIRPALKSILDTLKKRK